MTSSPKIIKETINGRVWMGNGAPAVANFPTLRLGDFYQDYKTGDIYAYDPDASPAAFVKWTSGNVLIL